MVTVSEEGLHKSRGVVSCFGGMNGRLWVFAVLQLLMVAYATTSCLQRAEAQLWFLTRDEKKFWVYAGDSLASRVTVVLVVSEISLNKGNEDLSTFETTTSGILENAENYYRRRTARALC